MQKIVPGNYKYRKEYYLPHRLSTGVSIQFIASIRYNSFKLVNGNGNGMRIYANGRMVPIVNNQEKESRAKQVGAGVFEDVQDKFDRGDWNSIEQLYSDLSRALSDTVRRAPQAVIKENLHLGNGFEVIDMEEAGMYAIVDDKLDGLYFYKDQIETKVDGKIVKIESSIPTSSKLPSYSKLKSMAAKKDIVGINKQYVNEYMAQYKNNQKNQSKMAQNSAVKSNTTIIGNGWKVVSRTSKSTGLKCYAVVDKNGNGMAYYENGTEAPINKNSILRDKMTQPLISGYDEVEGCIQSGDFREFLETIKNKKSLAGKFDKKIRNIDNNIDPNAGLAKTDSIKSI